MHHHFVWYDVAKLVPVYIPGDHPVRDAFQVPQEQLDEVGRCLRLIRERHPNIKAGSETAGKIKAAMRARGYEVVSAMPAGQRERIVTLILDELAQ